MNPVILRMAIDSLVCSIDGPVREHIAEVLDKWKLQAQEDGTPAYSPMGGLDFAVQAQGSMPYRWVIKGEDATIRATASPKLPGAMVSLSAKGLAYYTPEELLAWLVAIVDDYLGPNGEPKTSRLDLCVDFQGFDVAGPHGAKFVTPARFRPVYPNIEHPETFQFGKGKVVSRVYNKTRELRVSGKTWMNALWEQHPDYDPTKDVWEALAEATGTHTLLERTSRSAGLGDLEQIVAAVAGYIKSAGAALDIYDFDEVWRILGNRACARLGEPVDFEAAVRRRKLQRLGREST
ncbi:MAG: hypothetical protein Q8K89_07505 [Actinomycetota bacterium]|nr:hypothetical protein [Actinomycetota bacterium]